MNPQDLALLPPPLDTATIFQALLLSFGLGISITVLHRIALQDRIVAPALSMSLVLLSMGGALVMLVIGESLARAFSLVGALAVVRFRTRLDNPLDIVFVFLTMAVGISCGVLAWRVGLIGTAILWLAVLIMGLIPRNRDVHLVRCDLVAHESREDDVDKIFDKHVSQRWLEQARSLRFGETLSMWYRVSLRRTSSLEQLIRELSALEGVERVVILANEEVNGDGD